MKQKILFISLVLALLLTGNCSSLIEVLGMGDLLEGMAKMTPAKGFMGEKTIVYTLNPNIHTFLALFNSRT